ncbi:hypothetical protein J2T55_000365 [Methylohalomonas lacus]|uniref:Lipoprotein n=1 Tax=Methylohalomonas lacus TaxID=398773 RepID=A0AAE3HJT6_9GAMM|nr:hypothetical protein [Methylohalomonas lacus]MCS3902369.1 hypothetical protein [Methylohalomonas lacus]
MKHIKHGLWLCLLIALIACSRLQPIENIASEPLPAGSEQLELEQIEAAIIRAGAKRGWILQAEGSGKLLGTYSPRDHMAKVRVEFDRQQFSIHYADSDNLLHEGEKIHRNYNRWVNNLRHDIIAEVAALAATGD